MREKRGKKILGSLAILLMLFAFNIINAQAAETVTVLLEGIEQKAYTTIQLGDQLEIMAIVPGERVQEIHWISDEPSVVSVEKDQDTSFLKANGVGQAVVEATIITEHGELSCELLVYTRTDPEQMVYLEDESEQLTDDEYVLKPRAAGDVTLYINGEIRRTYNTIGVSDTRTAMIEVEGEVIQNINWSSSDNSVVSISGDKDGATILAVSEGIATITADITTDQGKRSKDLIISTRTDVSLTGYANDATEMHQAANEESNINGNIVKGDKLDIRGMNGKYYWIYHENAYGFVLKSKVDIPAVSLSLPESISMEQGKAYQLKAQLLPEQTTDKRLIWSSSNKRILTVDNTGLVKGVREGKASVTVKTYDGKLSAKCDVIVGTGSVSKSVVNQYTDPTVKASYSSVQINFQLVSEYKMDVRYYLRFEVGNKTWKSSVKNKKTNSKLTHNEKNLSFGTKYDYYIGVYFYDGSNRVLEIGPFNFKTKKPKVSLSLKKQNKSSIELKMKATPSNFYDSYQIRYKLKGKKYSTLNSKAYSKKGNTIKVNKKLPVGKVSYFELGLYKKGKLICSDKLKVQKGNTTVTTKMNGNLSKITVKWDKVDFAKGYEIYRSENKKKLGKKIKTVKKAGTTSYTDLTKNLKNPQEYYYQVRPYWKDGKKKKKGSSNRSRIEARSINKKANNDALRNTLGMGNKLAASGANMNKFFIPTENGNVFPPIKYQFDGKKLTIHLYIKYSSYEFTGKYYVDSKELICDEVSTKYILQFKRQNGQKYVDMFEQGLRKYYGGQLVKGSDNDFGKKVNFKTALVIHRSDKNEKYESGQKFIEVMIGGIDKFAYNIDAYQSDPSLYWYHAKHDTARIYMPLDEQVKQNRSIRYRNAKVDDYQETAVHEMGHILGLADAYYAGDGVDRCDENTETCIKFGKKDYRNMMIGNNVRFVPNDFEMMLKAYKDNEYGGVTIQNYKTISSKIKRSEVIQEKADKVKLVDYK